MTLAEAAAAYLEESLIWIENEYGSIEGRKWDPDEQPDHFLLVQLITDLRDSLAAEAVHA